jgi:hypothetical protein
MEELLEVVFFAQSMPRLHDEEQLQLRDSLEMAVSGVESSSVESRQLCDSCKPVRM